MMIKAGQANESTIDGNVEDPTEACADLSFIAGLSPQQQVSIVEALDRYLIEIEEGRPVDVSAILPEHPEIADVLSEYFDDLRLLCNAANTGTPLDRSGSTFGISHEMLGHELIRNASPSAPVPQRMGPYELGPIIGRGAMGIVYQAWDRINQQFVALKVLAYPKTLDEMRTQRFRLEARAASSLRHPNLVPIYAIGSEGENHYYAMKLIEGESLDRRIAAARKTQESANFHELHLKCAAPILGADRYKRIARIGACTARALHAAHTAGIIHRDVKPSNLMLGTDGQIWLTDFGLARIQAEVGLTRTGDLVGTLRYMSPEQAAGAGDLIDARTDVYGLGATLYELTTLCTAHRSTDGPSLLREIQEVEPQPPRQIDPDIPRDLETIIRRSMRPNAADRYVSAAAMARDLDRFIEGKPIAASIVTPGERLVVWAQKHRRLVGAAALGSIIAIVALCTHTILLTHEQSRTRAAKQLAEANYRQARRSIDTLGAAVAKRLMPIAEAADIRQDVLAETLRYYDQFIESSIDDPSLAVDVAVTRLEIARLTATTGAYPRASAEYEEAVDALQKIASEADDREVDIHLCRALNEWAMLASERGNQQAALARLEQARNVLGQDVTDVDKDFDAMITFAQALTCNHRGVVLLRTGGTSESTSELQHAIKLMRQLAPRLPLDDSRLRSELADAFSNLSVALDEAGEDEQAALAAQQSISIREFETVSNDPDQMIRLAIAHNNVAALHWQAGMTDRAVLAYETAVDLLEQSIHLAPSRTVPRDRLAVTLNNLGMALAASEDNDQAESIFERAIVLATPAVEADPSDVQAALRLSGIQNNLGVLLRDQNRRQEAQRLFRKSFDLQTRVAADASDRGVLDKSIQQVRSNLLSVTRTKRMDVDTERPDSTGGE